jgi:poly(3-hydroxyalkanoate) depolymerase
MLAFFLVRLMSRLGYDEFDVLGISWGGGLAQQVAFQHPRRCRRLVLVSTATGSLMIPANPLVLLKMVTPRRYRDPQYATSIAAQLYGGRLRAEPDLARTLLHEHSRVGTRSGYLLQLVAGAGWTSLPLLPFVRKPALILAGTDDPIIPLVNARIMRRLLPDATLHTYDDGHLGLVTQADELGPVVNDFLLAPPAGPCVVPRAVHRALRPERRDASRHRGDLGDLGPAGDPARRPCSG